MAIAKSSQRHSWYLIVSVTYGALVVGLREAGVISSNWWVLIFLLAFLIESVWIIGVLESCRRRLAIVLKNAIEYEHLYLRPPTKSAAARGRDQEATRAESTEPAERPLSNKQEVVPVDLPCIHCRYNLRGVPIIARCPECGVPIAESSRPDRLLFADPRWLNRVTRGLRIAQLNPLAFLPIWLNIPLAGSLFSVVFFMIGMRSTAAKLTMLSLLVGLPPLIASIGGWIASVREPPAISASNRERKRRHARRSIAVTWAVLALSALSGSVAIWREVPIMISLAGSFIRNPSYPATATAFWSFIAFVVLAFGSVGLCLKYLLQQSHRFGKREPFQRSSRLCAITVLIVLGLAAILVAVELMMGSAEQQLGSPIFAGLVGLIGLGLPLAYLSTMRLFRDYAVEFRQAARDHVPYPPILAQCRAADGDADTHDTAAHVIDSPKPERRETDTLQADVPCAGCDYNLRGLPKTSDSCPECGKALRESLKPDRLMFANRAWLRRIRQGLIVTEVGLISLPVWLISTPLVFLVNTELMYPLLIGGGCFVSTVIALGILIARPPNGRVYLIVASATVIVTVVNSVFWIIYVGVQMAERDSPAWMGRLAGRNISITWIALIIATVVFLRWLRALLLRVPSARLAKRAGQCAWQLPVFVALFAAAMQLLPNSSNVQDWGTFGMILGFVPTVTGIILFASCCVILDVLRKSRQAVSAALGRQIDFDDLYLERTDGDAVQAHPNSS